jgi:hypothetical protein
MIEDWFDRVATDLAAGDVRLARVVEIRGEMFQIRETNPDRMLALIDEGRSLARQFDHSWLALYFSVRRAEALMLYKGDVAAGLEQAVSNSLEVRKPAYDALPWKASVHNDLVVGYLYTDPVGYAGMAREALDWLDAHARADGTPRYLILARRRWLAWEVGELDEAVEWGRQSLALAEQDPDPSRARFFTVFAYSVLCHIAWQRGDFDWLRRMAAEGEELARQSDTQLEMGEFQMWQALLHRRSGDTRRAQKMYHQAARCIARLGKPADSIYFDAACAYHDLGDEQEEALAARDAELAILAGHHRWGSEVECRLDRCRRLVRLGRLTAEDIAETRAAVARLRQPREAADRLAEIERGLPA